MAIKTVHKENRECACELPRKGSFIAGDVVQCTDCESYFRCKGMSPVDQYKPGDESLMWERVRKLRNERENRDVWEPFSSGIL